MARSKDIKTDLVRLAFAQNLIVPIKRMKGPEGKQTEKECWETNLLIPKTSVIKPYTEAVLEAADGEWTGKAAQWLKDGLIKSPILDGDGPQALSKKTGERHVGFAGHWFIRLSTTQKPVIVGKDPRFPATKDEVYSGAWVYAVINAYTWADPKNGKGVSFGLSMIQKVKDDEKMGGGPGDPTQYFAKIEDEGDAPAETLMGAGAGGLFA